MKNNIAIILATISLSAATTSTFAESDNYIPWTFDDFNSNCEIIDSATTQADEEAVLQIDICEEDVSDDIGW
ncbi:MAG: hypothetical protein IMF17_01490 [Proteobacteria bacterium]|nr:hypothetical protein [Pseudomonadota bacterium]